MRKDKKPYLRLSEMLGCMWVRVTPRGWLLLLVHVMVAIDGGGAVETLVVTLLLVMAPRLCPHVWSPILAIPKKVVVGKSFEGVSGSDAVTYG